MSTPPETSENPACASSWSSSSIYLHFFFLNGRAQPLHNTYLRMSSVNVSAIASIHCCSFVYVAKKKSVETVTMIQYPPPPHTLLPIPYPYPCNGYAGRVGRKASTRR